MGVGREKGGEGQGQSAWESGGTRGEDVDVAEEGEARIGRCLLEFVRAVLLGMDVSCVQAGRGRCARTATSAVRPTHPPGRAEEGGLGVGVVWTLRQTCPWTSRGRKLRSKTR